MMHTRRKEFWVEKSRGHDPFYRNVTLPDEVLLEIFALYGHEYILANIWWLKLVHVCRQWRQVVFASPRRLNLRLRCTPFTPARKMLDMWPNLPLVISHDGTADLPPELADNVIAALERTNRVSEIWIFRVPSSLVKRFAAAMQEPFPALTHLSFLSDGSSAPVLPSSFLGGHAPRLESLDVENIPIPPFRKLPSCSPSLATLHLTNNLYIPPGVIVDCLSGLIGLETFHLGIRSRPDQTSLRPPMLARVVLPSLTSFLFNGVSEYFEDLIARIDTPTLDNLSVSFFNQLIFDIPRLSQFISRTEQFELLDRAGVAFNSHSVKITLVIDDETETTFANLTLSLAISCTPLDWQVFALEQVCSSTLHSLSNLNTLYIWQYPHHEDRSTDGVENTQWLELLRPFTTLETLIVEQGSIPFVERILGALAGGVTEAMPALELIYIDLGPLEPIPDGIEQFVTARQLSGRPVAVERTGEPVVDL
ncbi:hypothetical protein F5148DRAFT_792449 [Russula earlei]|uniref:Uncharacterized protein n=1 Tax=Russula earlei TaxID=71964 RepID=A0ACC0UN47_9AGAM|nr:hypothetical protein F5148DRAFT_792449 [Russula earlei]